STSPQPSAPCRIELGWPALTTSATPSSATPSRTNVALAGRTFVRCQSTSAVSKGPSATISDAVSGRACASPVYANRLNTANPSEPSQKRLQPRPSSRSDPRPSRTTRTSRHSTAARAQRTVESGNALIVWSADLPPTNCPPHTSAVVLAKSTPRVAFRDLTALPLG